MNMMRSGVDSRGSDARTARLAIRRGEFTGNTAGLAPGCIQGNIIILPQAQATAFIEFCEKNHRACPLVATSEPGDPRLPTLGADIDMRHDLPGYRVFRDGAMVGEVTDVADLWRDDLVTCVLGCSFTFEGALLAEGIPLRHIQRGCGVAMYRTNRLNVAVGPFGGTMVVSMRPLSHANAERAAEITARYPDMHGAPVHIGDPAELGIADIMRVDYGDAVPVEAGEVSVFWACGVTSQVAVESARLPFFISHAPGKMLITDQRHAAAA